jgi:transposase
MYHYQQVIVRIKMGDSDRRIMRSGLMGRKKVAVLRKVATDRQWLLPGVPLPTEAELQSIFSPASCKGKPSRLEPYKPRVRKWFEQGVQGTTIHEALVRNHGYEGAYSSVRRYLDTLRKAAPKATVSLEFKPGEIAQVDFGTGPGIPDGTGKALKTWFFVMTLAWSRHMYAELVPDQKLETWLGCHQRAFEFFGGVPEAVRIDNPKCAITKACFHDPQVQRSYHELASAYGFRIDPCPVADPQKKGRVEAGVKYVKNSFFPLRDIRSLAQGNEELLDWVTGLAGNRIHGTTREKPLTLFAETEAALLRPLPPVRPECILWSRAVLHGDCHVVADKRYYSAPFAYIGHTLWIRTTEKMVRLYKDHELVATHPRLHKPGARSTNKDHYPPEARAYLLRDPQWCLHQAEKIGPACRELIETLFADRVLDRLRAAQGIIRLKTQYGAKRLEMACQRALVYETPQYRSVKEILKRGLDQHPLETQNHLPLGGVYTGKARFQTPVWQ